MKNSTWKITSIRDGEAVASIEGVSQENAVAAIRNAMYGRDPLVGIDAANAEVARDQSETLAAAA